MVVPETEEVIMVVTDVDMVDYIEVMGVPKLEK